MHLNNCERISFDKCWKGIILKWKEPKYIHRRILPTTFSKLSLLYTQFIILDCIYKKHMFQKKERKKKAAVFTQGLFYKEFSELSPFLAFFLFQSQETWDFTFVLCADNTPLAKVWYCTCIDRVEEERARKWGRSEVPLRLQRTEKATQWTWNNLEDFLAQLKSDFDEIFCLKRKMVSLWWKPFRTAATGEAGAWVYPEGFRNINI